MLMSFSVKNFKNFNEWFDFDLSSSNNYEFNSECIENGLVKTALIYGYNGVGKSNLGLAIFDIINHLTDKNVNKSFYTNYQNAISGELLVEFKYRFKFKSSIVCYSYGKTSVDELVYEVLSIDDNIVLQYNRTNNVELYVSLEGTAALNKNISDLKISAVKYVKSNSVLMQNKESELFYSFCDFVDKMLIFWSLDSRSYLGYITGTGDIMQDIIAQNHINEFKNFLHETGVKDNIKLEKSNINKETIVYDFGGKTLDFYPNSSAGVRSLALFYYWYQRMRQENIAPSFVFIDEYDAFYHAAMSELVIEKLKQMNIQVILTTHNTGLMNNELMRPDCCFLMYNDKILPLSKRISKELRYAHNVEKMYKAGAFNE